VQASYESIWNGETRGHILTFGRSCIRDYRVVATKHQSGGGWWVVGHHQAAPYPCSSYLLCEGFSLLRKGLLNCDQVSKGAVATDEQYLFS